MFLCKWAPGFRSFPDSASRRGITPRLFKEILSATRIHYSLEPTGTPLRRFERLGEVPAVSPHLPVAQLKDLDHAEHQSAVVANVPLDDPQTILHQHAAHTETNRRGRITGVRFLELPQPIPAPDALPDWGISIT